jgi:hypothetical protein
MKDEKGDKHPIRLPISKVGGWMKDKSKYLRRKKHKHKEDE